MGANEVGALVGGSGGMGCAGSDGAAGALIGGLFAEEGGGADRAEGTFVGASGSATGAGADSVLVGRSVVFGRGGTHEGAALGSSWNEED